MIYTDMTRKAMKLCFNAHKDQVDKEGMPYVFHPYHLAEQMKDEITAAVALLHDVIEDTDFTIEDLKREGFPDEVCEALALLTHDENEDYMDYVERICFNDVARKVKKADLKHNSDLTRKAEVTEKDLERVKKYKEALSLISKYERGDYLICGNLDLPQKEPLLRGSIEPRIKEEKPDFLVTRDDGKELCKVLKEARREIAKANGIPFESEDCPNEGPCAGTCAKCDAELDYLEGELEKIPEEDRVWPELDVNPFKPHAFCKASPEYDSGILMGMPLEPIHPYGY